MPIRRGRTGIGVGGGVQIVSELPEPVRGRQPLIAYVEADYYASGGLSEAETTFTLNPAAQGFGRIGGAPVPAIDGFGNMYQDGNRATFITGLSEALASRLGGSSLNLDGVSYGLRGLSANGVLTNNNSGPRWVAGTPITLRFLRADGQALGADGRFYPVRDDDEPLIKEGFYHVSPETGLWVEGLGLAEGGLPAVFLPETGLSDADIRDHKWKGILVGLSREDAGADWRLVTAAGAASVALDATTRTVTVTRPAAEGQADIVAALNGLEVDGDTTLYAVLIGGSNGNARLEAAPLNQPFSEFFSRGSLPRPSSDEIDARVQALVKPYALDGGPLIAGTDAESAFVLEPEVTQAFLLGIIGLTEAQLNDLFTGAAVTGTGAGRVITVTQADGSTVTLAVPDTGGGGGGGTADGVVNSAAFSADGMTLTLGTSAGGTITANIPESLRQAGLSQELVQNLITAYLQDYDTAAEVAADIAQALTNYRRLATVVENSGDVTLTPGDRGSTLRHTGNAAATYTPAVADPPVGWWVRLLNTSSAVLTFDVGVARRIEGAGQSVEIAAGDCVTVQFLGAATWAVITNTAGAAAAAGGGGQPARELVVLAPIRVTNTNGAANVVWPADYATYKNYEVVTGDDEGVTDTIRGTTAFLALQQDGDIRIFVGDKDEAGSRKWLTWTPSTRTMTPGQQGTNTNVRIKSARLYDDGGGGSGEVADNSLEPIKAKATTPAEQAAWRARFMSAHISVRTDLPPIADANIGSDVVILRAGIADGISIVDITDPNTPITAAEVGDVLMALTFREAVWTRVGNIITGRGDATARAAIQELQLRYNYLAKRGGATLQLYHLGAGNEQYTQDAFVALAGQNLTITGHIDDPALLPDAGRFFLRIANGAGGHTIKTQGGAGTAELQVFQLNAVERTARNQLTAGTVQFTFQITAAEMAAIFTDASSDPIDAAFVAFDVGMSEADAGTNEADVLAVFYEHLVGSAGLTPEQAAEIQRDGQGVQTALAATRANAARLNAVEPRTTALEGKVWPGTVAVTPHELHASIGAFTMRATLTRTTGTFPNGARMRIAAGARNGAFVHATEDKAAPATLAFDAAQSRALIQNTSNGWIGGTLYLDVYESDEATRIVRIPLYIPVVQGSVGPLITNIAAYDAAQDRFEDSTGGQVTLHPGSIVLTTQVIYDAAVADSFAFPAEVVFLTR